MEDVQRLQAGYVREHRVGEPGIGDEPVSGAGLRQDAGQQPGRVRPVAGQRQAVARRQVRGGDRDGRALPPGPDARTETVVRLAALRGPDGQGVVAGGPHDVTEIP
ncbi:hypothetical protein [Streptomyces cacaoi]|uniref:hypothetical protein n=1 Tax=Streptomyces cacaoi TaxID=1898 RepID=UPI00332CDF47